MSSSTVPKSHFVCENGVAEMKVSILVFVRFAITDHDAFADIRNAVESWKGKNWLMSSDKGSTKNAQASSSAAPKRKADNEDASTSM
jgi:hypothetical protein